jgi:hypothetical protein
LNARNQEILVSLAVWFYLVHVSTVLEIEAAIEKLPVAEQATLRARLSERAATKPKTGAELAALWPGCFHLTTQEADDFARELESSRQFPPKALVWE